MRPRSSGAMKSSTCCCGAGSRRKPVTGEWCCFQASRVSANRDSLRNSSGASSASRIRGSAISVRPIIRTARSTRFITQLERAAGFTRGDDVEQKLGKLREMLAPAARGNDEIDLLAELLSLPSAAAELNFSPQRKHEKLLEAFLHQLEALARSRPVLMVFEDAHWADPTSRELLDLTNARAGRLPVLLVISFRPEFQHGWGGEPHVTALSLNRLAGGDGAMLVERLAGNTSLSRETVDEIVERADGVPLFVEELTKAVLE